MKPEDAVVREAHPEDLAYIYNSWMKSVQDNFEGKHIPKSIFFPNYKDILDNILSRAEVKVLVNPEDSDHIFGYVVYEEVNDVDIIHFLYIKYNFRKLGLGKYLLSKTVPNFNKETVFVSFLPFLLRKDSDYKPKLFNTDGHELTGFGHTKKKFKLLYNPFLRFRATNKL